MLAGASGVWSLYMKSKVFLLFALSAVMPAVAFAQSVSDVTSAIQSSQQEILGYIATFGGVAVAIALAGVGWRVGAKLIKRLGGVA